MILITGDKGQLGQALCQQLGPRAIGTGFPQLDITDQRAVQAWRHQHPIKALLNCAADTLDFFTPNRCQIFHYPNEGVASLYDFAQAIFRARKVPCQLVPCLSQEFPTQAQRPTFSVLNKSKIKNLTNPTIPHWQESLKVCLNQQF